LNYIDLSLDLDLGRLVRYQPLYNTSLGWALKHRSGIFGLINNVKKGGSNYNTLYIETKF
jgi:outer membrane protein